jgi:hypothetical protein
MFNVQLFNYSIIMTDQDFKKIFTAHRADFPDEGFTERVIRQLPKRNTVLPQVVMVVFVMIGLVLTFAIQGVTPLFGQINSLITSISQLQTPSPIAVITYLGILGWIGIIGYSMAQADVG